MRLLEAVLVEDHRVTSTSATILLLLNVDVLLLRLLLRRERAENRAILRTMMFVCDLPDTELTLPSSEITSSGTVEENIVTRHSRLIEL